MQYEDKLLMQRIFDEVRRYDIMYNTMCDSIDDCSNCVINDFVNKYENSCSCETIFMALQLLGNSKDTNDFLEQQRENMRRDYCDKNKCTDCHVRMILSENNYTLTCLEIYVGMALLKDV